jgi:hypothetical protein
MKIGKTNNNDYRLAILLSCVNISSRAERGNQSGHLKFYGEIFLISYWYRVF